MCLSAADIFLVKSLESFLDRIAFANKDTSSFPICIHFISAVHLILPATLSTHVLNRTRRVEILILVLILVEMLLIDFFSFRVMLA